MKILVIGGTLFLGRHIVETAVRNGHEVTLFNRSRSNKDLFPDLEKIIGDRDKDLEQLKGRKWDAVIDTCGYIPRIVEKSAEELKDSIGKYVFISTISVYKDFSKPGITESSELARLGNEADETLNNETYGPLKTHCEERVKKHFPDNQLIIRPGLIVGPDDYSDRFTYWPVRIQKGWRIVIPENTNYPVQFIDVRDLAEFVVKCIEENRTGIFNATGPEKEMHFQELIDACVPFAAEDIDLEFIRIPDPFLEEKLAEHKVYLPLAEAKGEWAGIEQVDCSKAIGAGLSFRPLSSTVIDTLVWYQTKPEDYVMKTGLNAETERKIIDEYLQLKK